MDIAYSSAIKTISSLRELAEGLVDQGQEILLDAIGIIETLLEENSELKVNNARLITDIEKQAAEWKTRVQQFQKLEVEHKAKIGELEAKIVPPKKVGIRSAPPPKSKYYPEPKP